MLHALIAYETRWAKGWNSLSCKNDDLPCRLEIHERVRTSHRTHHADQTADQPFFPCRKKRNAHQSTRSQETEGLLKTFTCIDITVQANVRHLAKKSLGVQEPENNHVVASICLLEKGAGIGVMNGDARVLVRLGGVISMT